MWDCKSLPFLHRPLSVIRFFDTSTLHDAPHSVPGLTGDVPRQLPVTSPSRPVTPNRIKKKKEKRKKEIIKKEMKEKMKKERKERSRMGCSPGEARGGGEG